MIEACFFDLDKTVIDEQGRLYDGLESPLDLSRRRFAMTILTARGGPRFREAVRENPALTVTPGMPVALENGARIVDDTASRNLAYQPLSYDERAAVLDYIVSQPPLRYVAFHPRDPQAKTVLWSPDPAQAAGLHAAYSHNADVFTSELSGLFRAIARHDPCMITCRTNGEPPADLPQDVQWYTSGSTVNFIPAEVTKGTAALTIADTAGLQLDTILAAGNDANDLPVLQLPGLACPVAVGLQLADMRGQLPPHTVYLPQPVQLGNFVMGKVVQS
ncbi:MAG TPA: HAD hydrolase family protein [Candidatus Saccharimonadales bacterium]